jgi:hypothetical protein
MAEKDRQDASANEGGGVELREYLEDARCLAADEFEDRHGSAFLILSAPQLRSPEGPAATVVQLVGFDEPEPECTAGISILAYSVQRSGRSVGHLVTVGRTANNDVVISDLSVSRFHAFVKQGDDGFFQIQDAGSTNGTVVNDSCVPAQGHGAAVQIKTGDRVRLGQVELTFLSAKAFQEYVGQLES